MTTRVTAQSSTPDRLNATFEEHSICRVSEALRSVLNGWLRGAPADAVDIADAESALFAELVERNRFDALMWVALPEGRVREALADRLGSWRRSYEQSLIRNTRQLRAALEAGGLLEGRGIPSIGVRGPFAGVSLYRDVALRYFTDVDFLIPRQMRDRAWDILSAAGYRFSHSFMTRGACARHHLQWPFRHAEKGVSLDLHWAVDHPYKLLRVDYEEIFASAAVRPHAEGDWREPRGEHALILACLHAEKECRLLGDAPSGAQIRAHARSGLWRHWLDIALLLRNARDLDGGSVVARAEAWGVLRHVVTALTASAEAFDMSLPADIAQAAAKMPPRGPARRRRPRATLRGVAPGSILATCGFRGECLSDIRGYLFPAPGHFAGARGVSLLRRRALHAIRGAGRLLCACFEFTWLWMRPGRQRRSCRSGATLSGGL